MEPNGSIRWRDVIIRVPLAPDHDWVRRECYWPNMIYHGRQRAEEVLPGQERATRLEQLNRAVAVCPGDVVSRVELAVLLEDRGEVDGALDHWRLVLKYDLNNLKAWEGLARCRHSAASLQLDHSTGVTRETIP